MQMVSPERDGIIQDAGFNPAREELALFLVFETAVFFFFCFT